MKVNFNVSFKFQSTYLYKVRLTDTLTPKEIHVFQSTYLYKVRHNRRSRTDAISVVSIHVPI